MGHDDRELAALKRRHASRDHIRDLEDDIHYDKMRDWGLDEGDDPQEEAHCSSGRDLNEQDATIVKTLSPDVIEKIKMASDNLEANLGGDNLDVDALSQAMDDAQATLDGVESAIQADQTGLTEKRIRVLKALKMLM